MATALSILILTITITLCVSQRPFYAGIRPVGYPDVKTVQVESRFAETDLSPQLNGDSDYANRLDKLPKDHQPFWYINKKHYDELMKNPKVYPQKPSDFVRR